MQVFELFDIKRNNVIEFGEFVRSLSVFHPKAPLQEKASCESVVPEICPRPVCAACHVSYLGTIWTGGPAHWEGCDWWL